jgi:hypothetical protein
MQFDNLHPDIKQFYDWDKIRDAMRYQGALFSLRVIKSVYLMVYDVAFQCYLIPLFLWTTMQKLATEVGACSQPRGQYYELIFAPIFFITVGLIDTFVFIGFGWIQTLSIMHSFGFSNATPSQLVLSRVLGIVAMAVNWVPLIMFCMVITLNF